MIAENVSVKKISFGTFVKDSQIDPKNQNHEKLTPLSDQKKDQVKIKELLSETKAKSRSLLSRGQLTQSIGPFLV
jgi:hypothetical protein